MDNLLEFKELLFHLKNRRNMYVFDSSYSSLTSFIIGYLMGIKNTTNIDYGDSFQRWLRKKEVNYFSLHWSAYILSEISDNNPVLAEENLLELLEDFVADKIKEEGNAQKV